MTTTKNFRNAGWIKFDLTAFEVDNFLNDFYCFNNETDIKDVKLFWKIFRKYKNTDSWKILLEGGALKNFSKKAIICSEEIMRQ